MVFIFLFWKINDIWNENKEQAHKLGVSTISFVIRNYKEINKQILRSANI